MGCNKTDFDSVGQTFCSPSACSGGDRLIQHRHRLPEGQEDFFHPCAAPCTPDMRGGSVLFPLPHPCLPPFALQERILTLPSSSREISGGLTDGGCSVAPILPSYRGAASHAEPSESIMAEDRLREKRGEQQHAWLHMSTVFPAAANCRGHRSFCVQHSLPFPFLLFSPFLSCYLALFFPRLVLRQ